MTDIRLCVDHPLGKGQSLTLSEGQVHYLFAVMRVGPGTHLKVFNGVDGEWLARVETLTRRSGVLRCERQTRIQSSPADLWLLFAPLKKARTDFLVEKAAELGVALLQPLQTDYTSAERLRQDKAEAHVREAAEQCEGMWLATVRPLTTLDRVLAEWPSDRKILWADESRRDNRISPSSVLSSCNPGGGWAVLVGPEGGFSETERTRLRNLPYVVPVALGPRVLRAETAAVALLTLWQAHLGDWT